MGVLGNAIYDLIKKLYSWHKSKNVNDKDSIPNVFITIYPNPLSKKGYSFFIRIDKEPKKEEIVKIIKRSKGATKN